MARAFKLLFSLLLSTPLAALLIGNPAQPTLQTTSILDTRPFPNPSAWWSFRAGYVDDWIYQQNFKRSDSIPNRTNMKLSTYAGILTLNFKDRLDVYGIIGSSRMQLDQEMFTKRALGWGVGMKWILLKLSNFAIGADVKYFNTDQKPRFLIMDSLPYNIVSDYRLCYEEIQGALGMCYHSSFLAPYIYLTYLKSTIEPTPRKVLIRFPDANMVGDTTLCSLENKKKWGLSAGLTLIDRAKATLAFEWRAFNQNAVDWNLEIRF